MKKFLSLLLVAVLCLSMVGCGLSEEDAVGIWSGAYTYNGNDFVVVFELFDDGSYIEVIEKNGSIHKVDMGTYTIEKGLLGTDVVLDSDTEPGTTRYEYRGGALYNNDHKFTKD